MSTARALAPAPALRGGAPIFAALALLLAYGCGSTQKPAPKVAERAQSMDLKGVGGERCDGSKPNREVSEYDVNGDGVNDVRKVFLAIGEDVEQRLVMICREADINGDGRKDVIRYYDDDGRSLREESDRDFDGRMDMALIFQDGKVVLEEVDENHDGKVDTKLFFENEKPLRAERDLTGRSTPEVWRPDRWEYYEGGQMVRMGTDLDGDSRVDRWDRDVTHKVEERDMPDPEAVPTETAAKTEEGAEAAKDAAAKKPTAKSSDKTAAKKKK
jgi:hypothetical protein